MRESLSPSHHHSLVYWPSSSVVTFSLHFHKRKRNTLGSRAVGLSGLPCNVALSMSFNRIHMHVLLKTCRNISNQPDDDTCLQFSKLKAWIPAHFLVSKRVLEEWGCPMIWGLDPLFLVPLYIFQKNFQNFDIAYMLICAKYPTEQ